ncbi:MAG: asparaginase [Fibrobacteria bacterium]
MADNPAQTGEPDMRAFALVGMKPIFSAALITKGGANGLHCAALPGLGLGFAMKVVDGTSARAGPYSRGPWRSPDWYRKRQRGPWKKSFGPASKPGAEKRPVQSASNSSWSPAPAAFTAIRTA